MIGSVFSPYYAWSGRHRPHNFCGLNVGLYGKGVKRWTLTERGERSVAQSATTLSIGPSALRWTGDRLAIDIDEWAVPVPRKVQGRITIHPEGLNSTAFSLDRADRHKWCPLAPKCRVEASFSKPGLRFSGHGYIDSNWGTEPLEQAFSHWDWSRAPLENGAGLLYDAFEKDGTNRQLALHFDHNGTFQHDTPPPRRTLKRCPIWRMPRTTLAAENTVPKINATQEDTPFYSRSWLETEVFGEKTLAVHESLDLKKFANPIVRGMLPFRMPRRP